MIALLAVLAVVLAACSDSSGKPAADRARQTTTTRPKSPTSTTLPATTTTSTAPSAPTTSSEPSTTDPGSPSLTPQAGGSGSGSSDYAAQLKWAQCMQAHDVDVPDPVAPGGGGSTSQSNSGTSSSGSNNVNPNSPQYIAANQACQSLLPAGSGPSLSGPGGS